MPGMRFEADIMIAGGSLGGVQAARCACGEGLRVWMCERSLWIGGQLTSQAVPPDEHAWIEEQGAPRSYMAYREQVRQVYRSLPEAGKAMRKDRFCPGGSWVSRIAHEPRVAHALLRASLEPFIQSGLLHLEIGAWPVRSDVREGRILSVACENDRGETMEVFARMFLDATDTGEMLPLTGTEYRIGAESREETGENMAPEKADPLDQQPVTWVAALRLDAERSWMEKPASYDFFAHETIRGHRVLDWEAWGAEGLRRFAMYDHTPGAVDLGLWRYRRIVCGENYTDGRRDVSLLNWPQNDYIFSAALENAGAEENLRMARELTKCTAYWLWAQGYPVSLDGEALGTGDGLAQAPYIRESRRILACRTVRAEDVLYREGEDPICRFPDSIGVGHYAMDLHMTTRSRTSMYARTRPFEIPLGAMIPRRTKNLIPASKNIGTTHLTTGCFRLHPTEWTVGEAAGLLAAFSLRNGWDIMEVWRHRTGMFQQFLTERGVQLHWRETEMGLE